MSRLLQSTFEAALRHHQAGDLAQAASGYEAALRIDTAFAPAYHYLGLVRYQTGKPDEGISLIRRALAFQPDLTEAHYNLGNIYRELGRRDEAVASYRTVLSAEPDNPGALGNLALLLKELGRHREAEPLLRRLVRIAPDYAAGHTGLGAVLLETDRPIEALTHLRHAVALAPTDAEAHYNLGRAHLATGSTGEAEQSLRAALRINPHDADAYNDLGQTLLAQYRYTDAVGVYEELVRYSPDNGEYRKSLGNALHSAGRLGAAIATYRDALERRPADTQTRTILSNVLLEQGRVEEAVAAYREVLALDPHVALAHSNLLFALCFLEGADPQEVFAEHRRFDAIYGLPLTRAAPASRNNRDPERRLRIGYLSPDFRYHPGGHFLLPPVEHRDRDRFELYLYSTTRHADGFTERFQKATDHWRQVGALSDEGLERTIREDGIDILFECAGHMAGRRLLVCARRPAPIQISFPLYPNTTGLSAINYRIMDSHFAPPGSDAYHSETLIRLPDAHVCYEPSDREVEPSARPPSDTSGHVTFGCFNNVAKVGPRTIALWARLLRAVPGSRLVLKWLGLNDTEESWFVAAFRQHGIAPDQLVLSGRAPSPYTPYLDIDIALDPLHANGGTTTCDALWMGVPVISCPGPIPFSRVGLCHLTNAGLPELLAKDEDDYLAIAVGLASDRERLRRVRQGLKERFARSPLMDGPRYTCHLESEMRRVWKEWCQNPR
jgi:predicted O-linked N-acetylglucosamine transferase (SPINDLY family)